MEENTQNEQFQDLDKEQLQDVTGGLQGAPGMSRRTRRAPQPSGSNESFERAMRIGQFHLSNGDHEKANFFFDLAKTHMP